LNDGTEHYVTAKQVEEWEQLYPAVDVMQALRSMRGWLLVQGARRKTRQGVGKFITAWLNREQDRGRESNSQAMNRKPTNAVRSGRNTDYDAGRIDVDEL
jgi:hypothetical protein